MKTVRSRTTAVAVVSVACEIGAGALGDDGKPRSIPVETLEPARRSPLRRLSRCAREADALSDSIRRGGLRTTLDTFGEDLAARLSSHEAPF